MNRIPFATAGGMLPVFSARASGHGYGIQGPVNWCTASDQVFARWSWTGDRLIVETDRWGIQPIFWAATPGAISVSPSLDALLDAGVPAALDDDAMAVFLRLGYFVGEDTAFAAIRTLPAAGRLTWSRDGVDVVSYARPPAPAAGLSKHEAMGQFASLVTASAARCSADAAPSAVLLGGGPGARHLLLALDELRRKPARCVTLQPHPPAAGDEVRVARQLADALGIRHTVIARRSDRVESHLEAQELTHSCADSHAHLLPLRDYLQHLQFHAFDALAADILVPGRRLERDLHRMFSDGRGSDVASHLLGDPESVEPALERLLARDAQERFARYKAVARVAAEAGRHAGAANPIGSWLADTSLRRNIALAAYGVLEGCRVSTPFLDATLTDFLLSLPFDLVADGRLHADTLQRRYPALAQVPFETNGRHRAEDRRAVRRDAADLLRVVSASRSALVHRPSVVARVFKAVASGARRHLSFMPRLLHLLEVERRTRGDVTATAGSTSRAA